MNPLMMYNVCLVLYVFSQLGERGRETAMKFWSIRIVLSI